MNFNPPVSERNTKELFNIISNDKRWTKEIQILAEKELINRDYTLKQIEVEKQKRIYIIQKFIERQTWQRESNRTQSYNIKEMMFIVVLFPISTILFVNPLAEFWELDKYNYKKKIWQRIGLIIISLLLHFLILSYLL